MARMYALLSQACGSLALALLVVTLMTAISRSAFADEPPGGGTCAGDAICNINCCYNAATSVCEGSCKSVPNCITCACTLTAKTAGECKCE